MEQDVFRWEIHRLEGQDTEFEQVVDDGLVPFRVDDEDLQVGEIWVRMAESAEGDWCLLDVVVCHFLGYSPGAGGM